MKISVINGHHGYGDVLCCLWAITAARRAGHEVAFFTRKVDFARLWDPGAMDLPWAPEDARVIFGIGNEDVALWSHRAAAGGQLSRIRLIHSRLQQAAGAPLPPPEPPQLSPDLAAFLTLPVIAAPWGADLDWSRVVLLFPFSAHAQREWPAAHWRVLAVRLEEEGLQPIAMGGAPDAARLSAFPRAIWGLPWLQTMAAMQHARSIVANDSGAMHVAASLGLSPKTIGLSAITAPATFAEYTQAGLHLLTPTGGCTGCHFQPAGGYTPACITACAELASIRVGAVLTAVLAILKQ